MHALSHKTCESLPMRSVVVGKIEQLWITVDIAAGRMCRQRILGAPGQAAAPIVFQAS